MGITDELRCYINEQQWCAKGVLTAIANRIDMAHEHGMEERADRYSELRAKMNNCYVELPKDADGEYIHIGDRMENNERVARIVLTDDSWEPSVYLEKLPNVLHEYFCNEISHYHTPTVEDVLREMIAAYMDTPLDGSNDGEFFAKFAAKLRLAGSDAE